jgi:phosphate transport system substrate-binding protein
MVQCKRFLQGIIVMGTAFLLAASCSVSKKSNNFRSGEITVISREEGSGTRGAFIELFGIEQKNADGKKFDLTSDLADITNSTEVMMTSVAGNSYAIGYISLGSLNKTVKALLIDGAAPTAAAIKNGSYKICRPFSIVTKKSGVSECTADFIRYILSADGQNIVEKTGYIAAAKNPEYLATGMKGKITVAGSSSVTPVMEKLAEDYMERNPGISVEVQMSDSTTGINSAINSISDIGMTSRPLKDSEIAQGIQGSIIATDGIAVIVNNENPFTSMSSADVYGIYTGEIKTWDGVK